MPIALKEEYLPETTPSGYVGDAGISFVCPRFFEDFKILCAEGRHPRSFKSYCESIGIISKRKHSDLKKLIVTKVLGYICTFIDKKFFSKTLSSRWQAFFP